jgi:hypothetical protein
MKKVFSIVSVLIIILAGLQVTISRHYCGGEPVASRISLSGAPASCGMEDNENNCPLPWHQLTGNCCEDHVRIAGTVNIFTIPYVVGEDQNKDKVSLNLANEINLPETRVSFRQIYTGFNPPGIYFTSSVNLENICVLRI